MTRARFFLVLLLLLVWVEVAMTLAADSCRQCRPEAFQDRRERMVRDQIEGRGVKDPSVLFAMGKVPRHCFVPSSSMDEAYEDYPLPIGEGQTISQPYVVAFMTQALKLKPTDRVLEVGTGSGYQAAVLSVLVRDVYTIEIQPRLARDASQRLACLGYSNVTVKTGDGRLGWEEYAPFDAVIVTAAASEIPGALQQQLRAGGRMCVPVGGVHDVQDLTLVEKDARGGLSRRQMLPVRFVPLVDGR
jgi:protein-L-isoaspartate(D-aspartate) O-methyltransferase